MSLIETDNYVAGNVTGSAPEVDQKTLKDSGRTISSVSQAFQVCENLIYDWKKGIANAARITAKLNGERPYNQGKLKNAGKDWKTNISTGFLATECARVLPRLFMPIKTAKYLTAAALPPNWADGLEKTEFFRQVVTETIRSWPKFNFYNRGLAREVGIFGFGYNVFFDEYDWRPTLMRMDKGFLPMGTEVMENEPSFFMAKYDYKPAELLKLVRDSVDAGRDEWQKDNAAIAISNAAPPVNGTLYENVRSFEELIRQSAWIYTYSKGEKVIRTWHLFSRESSGKVSHYILLADNSTPLGDAQKKDLSDVSVRLLYEKLDKFESMTDCVNTMVFDYGDGTVHGSWGAGQILYDLAAQVEKIRCDSIDNMRSTNKIKAQVPDAKNVNDVKLTINDQMMIISGAQFAGNTAAMPQDVAGYEALDQKLSQVAQQKIGAFVPPIPLQSNDVKAAQINAALTKEKELQESLLENWLIQFAQVIKTMTKRLCDKDSPDDISKSVRKVLLERMTEEEIKILSAQVPVKSVMEFTEIKSQQRAQFAQSVVNNPLFKQSVVARVMAEGIGDERFVNAIVLPEGDTSDATKAQHDQMLENSALNMGQPVPVIVSDNDYLHMQQLQPMIMQLLQSPDKLPIAELALRHYASHYSQGVSKKMMPKDEINSLKSWIASVEKHIAAIKQGQQLQQQQQMIQQHADQQAQELVASGQIPPGMEGPAEPTQDQAVPTQ